MQCSTWFYYFSLFSEILPRYHRFVFLNSKNSRVFFELIKQQQQQQQQQQKQQQQQQQ